MKRSLLFILFIPLIFFSQDLQKKTDLLGNIGKAFDTIQHEKFFLHTNKTTYFSGEKICWKAYVVSDFNDKPTTNTTNLYVNFYDSEKALISQQLFYCSDGEAYGGVILDDNLKTGCFYLGLDTQWNKNFDEKYVIQIDFINTEADNGEKHLETEIADQFSNEDIAIEFYPESGGLLEGFNNTVFFAIKLGNDYMGNVDGFLINNTTGVKIAKLKTNDYGFGIFKFIYDSNYSYRASINFNNKTYSFNLKEEKQANLIIQKKDTFNNGQEFSVKISDALATQNHNKFFFTTIYRNNQLLYVQPFQINERHRSYTFKFLNENLFNGFNKIGVFSDHNELMAERSFYFKKNNEIDFEITKKRVHNDTLVLSFDLKNSLETNLSISVLPFETKTNNNPSNILNEFLVNPYVFSKPHLNFESEFSDLERDLFLQIHAKKRKKILSTLSNRIYGKENGLSIKGVINTPVEDLKNCKVLLSSIENGILELTEIKENKSFEFNNLYLKEKSQYKLALLDNKGKIVKAGFYVYKVNKYIADSLLVYDFVKNKTIQSQGDTENTDDYIFPKDEFTERLDEVIIIADKKKNNKIDEVYINNPRILGNGFNKSLKIDDNDRMDNTIIQFLDNQPEVVARESTAGASVQFLRARYRSLTGSPEALILLNGMPTEADILAGMRLFDVQSIIINANGAGYGLRGGAGVVSIELKNGIDDKNLNLNENYFVSDIEIGFSPFEEKYKRSPLLFNSKLSKLYFETLDWIPNFKLQPNLSNILYVYVGEHEKVKLFINGMNNYGELIYKEVIIPITDKF